MNKVLLGSCLALLALNSFAETQPTTPPAETTATTPAATAPATTETIDCNYHIPATTKTVDQAIVIKWAEKATQQAFDFNRDNINNQLNALKACFTDPGWQSFSDALQKSGNIDAIKSQNLTVSSMVEGTPTISEAKDNQWKVTVALQVVYQNDKDKLVQPLNVDLVIGRKPSGDLGIMQMIASPKLKNTQASTQPSE